MPIFVTRETYVCQHSVETCRCRFGTDSMIYMETEPSVLKCPACTCEGVLDALFPFNINDDKDDAKAVAEIVGRSPRAASLISDLATHLQLMQADRRQREEHRRQHVQQIRSAKLRRLMQKECDLEKQRLALLTPDSVSEFRATLSDIMKWTHQVRELDAKRSSWRVGRRRGVEIVTMKPATVSNQPDSSKPSTRK